MSLGLKEDAIYRFIYLNGKLLENRNLVAALKKLNVIIPFLDFAFLTVEMQEALDSYICLIEDAESSFTFQDLVRTFPKIYFTDLGKVTKKEILTFCDTCEEKVTSSIILGEHYKIIDGEFQNLVVKVESISGEITRCSYKILKKKKFIEVKCHRLKYLEFFKEERVEHNLKVTDLVQASQEKKAIVVDGELFLYRNMEGYNNIYRARDRLFVGGAYGFYFTLLRLKELFVEYEIHVVFDGKSKKKALDSNYKANRPVLSERRKTATRLNKEWIVKFVKALGFPLYYFDNEEGDDVLGSVVFDLVENKSYSQVLIYSTDKDFFQLLSPKIQMYQPKQNFRGHNSFLKEEEVLERYNLNHIKKINWFRALKGDKGDNIPSINTILLQLTNKPSRIRTDEFISLINASSTLPDLKKALTNHPKFRFFMQQGCFDHNLKLLEINLSIFESLDLNDFKNKAEDKRVEELLLEFSFIKELEQLDKNLRIFKSLW